MPCACSLPACTSTPSQTVGESLLICALGAKKNGALPLRLCTRRAFVLAIVGIMFVSWPLLVYTEAQAGFESFLLEYHHERAEEAQHSRKLRTELHDNEQKRSAASIAKFWNRKFLRQGTGSADDSTKESNLKLLDFPPEGAVVGSDGDNFPERNSHIPYRRILIPDANECTNKDISITQRRDGSPGIPRFSVQIVNTCVSDCAPADIHVYCGWFASSPPPNPSTFQRLSYNDCLVNGGRPLGHGAIIQFQYANSFMYPIRFRSARFCR